MKGKPEPDQMSSSPHTFSIIKKQTNPRKATAITKKNLVVRERPLKASITSKKSHAETIKVTHALDVNVMTCKESRSP
jgi:hypothetical protein